MPDRTLIVIPDKETQSTLGAVKEQTLTFMDNAAGASRRQFLGAAAVAGATLALAPHLRGTDEYDNEQERKKRQLLLQKETRTLFFNLSHEDYVGHTYYLVLGNHRYRMEAVDESSAQLTNAHRSNAFLRSLPRGAVTHVVEKIEVPENGVQFGYTIKNPDTSTGAWSMSSMYLSIPTVSVGFAYTQARKALLGGAPLPVSAKRLKYGLPPAVTLQDVLDETAVVDSTDWAKAMVNSHPEMLCADPNRASHIYHSLIDARSTFQLSQRLELAGPATPQQSSPTESANNSSGWATLVPYTDDDGVTPLKATAGNNKGLILYNAQWQPNINVFVAGVVKPTSSAVKNDSQNLGTDITSGSAALLAADLAGRIWFRNDGITSINQSPGALNRIRDTGNANYALTNITPNYNGYSLTANTSTSGNTVTVTLNCTNWYLRWLGVYVQFYDANGVVVPTSKVPGISAHTDFDTPTSSYIGYVTPEFTIFGIPVMQSKDAITFTFPTSVATSASILASGLGLGSHTFQDTELVGIIMTSVFNLGLPALLIAFGIGASVDICVKTVVIPTINLTVTELLALLGNGAPAQIFTIFWRALVKGLANPSGPLRSFLVSFGEFLAEQEITEALTDAIPIVGAVLQAIGALGAEAEIAETACEVVLSPWTYQYRLVGTHNLSLTISPDPRDAGGFPASAATYTVTAIFDNGTPQTQTLNMPGTGVLTLPAVVFARAPLGGKVALSAAFYAQDGTLVGHGDTSVVNDVTAAPVITLTEVQVPITSATVYSHKQKTTLDSNGNHVWACAPAPATAPSVCEPNPGSLCSLRSISVSSVGYLGYGWQSYNTAGCVSSGAGQLDQMANIFVTNGANGNAQTDYAKTPCALEPGTKLVYDPLGNAGGNYYLDTTSNLNLIRQVQLNPPAFADPRANNAWGKFNLNPDDMLLHPAGALVSVNSENSRMESLHLPGAAVSDLEAGVSLLANLHGGLGTRPGLFDAPTVSTITSDGVILILESGNNRIHAVDLAANPVQHFKQQTTPYFLNFSATGGAGTKYLDMAVEFSGFIYVLSLSNSVYRLDIYHAEQSGTNPISTTVGFNAAKVTVDYWRNVYSLNYEVLTLPDGTLPNGTTEPSVSQWIPTVPSSCTAQPSVNWRSSGVRVSTAKAPSRLLRRNFWRAWTPGETA